MEKEEVNKAWAKVILWGPLTIVAPGTFLALFVLAWSLSHFPLSPAAHLSHKSLTFAWNKVRSLFPRDLPFISRKMNVKL